MKEYNLRTEPLQFIEVRDLTVSRQINELNMRIMKDIGGDLAES